MEHPFQGPAETRVADSLLSPVRQANPMTEADALLQLIKTRYGDRLTPEEFAEVRAGLQAMLDAAAAMRAVKLENGDEPNQTYKPEGEPE